MIYGIMAITNLFAAKIFGLACSCSVRFVQQLQFLIEGCVCGPCVSKSLCVAGVSRGTTTT